VDEDDARHEELFRRQRAEQLRGWSLLVGVAGPVLALVSLFVVLGFSLHSSFEEPQSAYGFLTNALVAVSIGVVLPIAAAVALGSVRRRASVGAGAGVLLSAMAGGSAALLLLPVVASSTSDAVALHAALERTTPAERQDPQEMRDALATLYRQTVDALPGAAPGQYNDETSGSLAPDDWLRGRCDLSVGHDGTDWTTVTLDSYRVADVSAALDAVQEDARSRGRSTKLLTDDQDGAVRGLAVSTRSGTLYVSPTLNDDVTDDSGEVELYAVTHCVR
jgi:hypothetical protein